jgi:RNA polymerase sigma factor (sigma-70 family)
MSDTDRKLITACRRGDERAWEDLIACYERLVFSIARRNGLSTDDAADVTQKVFIILLQSMDRVPDDVNLGGWLTTVARRHTWRAMARLGRELPGEKENVAESTTLLDHQASDPIDRWEMLQTVHDTLNRLSKHCRRLLLALYFDPTEPPYAEVARRLNMPVGSIGPTRARCLTKLKALLEEEEG